MAEQSHFTRKPDTLVPAENSESERFLQAIRQGSEQAIAAHGTAGRTIAVWRNGQVERVTAEQLLQETTSQANSK